MKFGLFGSRKDVEKAERRVMENGGFRLRTKIAKDITGDQSAIREFDVAEGTAADWKDRQPSPSDPVRLGDSYLPPSNKVGFMPFRMQTWDTATGSPRPDTFLHGDTKDAYVGGKEKTYTPGLEFIREEAGAYRFEQPDADAREAMNWAAGSDSGMADAASAQFPGAGDIGGRSVDTFTVKRIATLKAMYDEEDDDAKRKAIKSAARALLKASMDDDDDDSEDERKNTRKSSGAGTMGWSDSQPMHVAKRLGLFRDAIFSRQYNDKNGSAGARAADDFLSGGR
jgi:hypothetical protein